MSRSESTGSTFPSADDLAGPLETDTLALCEISSVTGDEAACADWIAERLMGTHLLVERFGNSVVARPVDDERPLISLFGHSDTVSPKAGDGPAHRSGDRLVGLGSSDMKGGLAVMLALARRRWDGPYAVAYVFYDREEGPWRESGLGPVLDACTWLRQTALAFCLEPSDNVVQVGCVGSIHATVTFSGKAAHSARPWQGENAIHKAAGLLVRLSERAPVDVSCGGFLFREVMSATTAEGGIGRNVIPDHFSINLNYRFAPGKSLEAAQDDVRAIVGQDGQVAFTDLSPSGRVVTDNPHLGHFLSVTGAALAPKQAWTDVARLSTLGIDAVNLGPGASAQAHQAGEWIERHRLPESYLQFARFLDATP